MTWWQWLTGRSDVSAAWLKELDRREQRETPISVSWRWPVNKIVNDAAQFQTQRLRKRA